MPTDKAGGEFGVRLGSYQYWNPFFDINQPLNADKTALFRITGEYLGNGWWVFSLKFKRLNIDPTLTLTNREDTSLTIQGYLSRQQQQAYQGLPVYDHPARRLCGRGPTCSSGHRISSRAIPRPKALLRPSIINSIRSSRPTSENTVSRSEVDQLLRTYSASPISPARSRRSRHRHGFCRTWSCITSSASSPSTQPSRPSLRSAPP